MGNVSENNIKTVLFLRTERRMIEKLKKTFDGNFFQGYLAFICFTNRCYDKTEAIRIIQTMMPILLNNSTDSSVVVEFLKTTAVLDDVKIFLYTNCRSKILTYILSQTNNAKFDMFGLLLESDSQPSAIGEGPVMHCALSGKFRKLKVWVRHGYPKTSLPASELRKIAAILKFAAYAGGAGNDRLEESDIKAILQSAGSSQKRCLQRLEAFAMCCRIFHYKCDAELFKNALNIVWEAIPDPYVTLEEMYEYLLSILQARSNDYLFKMCKTYTSAFPEARGKPRPRTLKHLSRCVIREVMGKSFQLPKGVKDLRLPESIKKYINFDE